MKSTRLVGAIVLSVLMVACGSQVAGGPPAALVKGTVAAGPVLPVSKPGQPANHPVGGATVEALRGRKVVAVTRTNAAGRYELRLDPGAYLIVARSDKYLRGWQSHSVNVSAAGSRTVDFVLDTGIR